MNDTGGFRKAFDRVGQFKHTIMKLKNNNYRSLLLVFFTLFTLHSFSQSACDNCFEPWGPVQSLTLTGKTLANKPPTCTYTFVYEYRERNCNGNIEIEIINIYVVSETSGMFCPLTNFSDCYFSRQAGIRSLVDYLGIPITFSQEKSCYALFKVDPPQAFLDCFLGNETVSEWKSFIECDATSCCSVTYTPNGNGTVNYVLNTSTPCTPSNPILPQTVTFECGGQTYICPVDQNQPLICEDSCPFGTGTLYKQADVAEPINEQLNNFEVYPNPTDDDLTFTYSVFDMAELELVVVNSEGQEIFRELIQTSNGNESMILKTDEWSAGIYTMRIQGNGQLLKTERISVIK